MGYERIMSEILEVHPETPQPRVIQRAVQVLKAGGVIVYPTDTVYGLGCDATISSAVEKIVRIKGRDPRKPLSFICSGLSEVSRFARISNEGFRIMRRCLPGPYTFVLRGTAEVPRWLKSKQKTVGIRIPNHPVPLALTRMLGSPIVSTSANRSGDDVLTDPLEVKARFSLEVDLILDCGLLPVLPSTVVSLVDEVPEILRQGAGAVDFLG